MKVLEDVQVVSLPQMGMPAWKTALPVPVAVRRRDLRQDFKKLTALKRRRDQPKPASEDDQPGAAPRRCRCLHCLMAATTASSGAPTQAASHCGMAPPDVLPASVRSGKRTAASAAGLQMLSPTMSQADSPTAWLAFIIVLLLLSNLSGCCRGAAVSSTSSTSHDNVMNFERSDHLADHDVVLAAKDLASAASGLAAGPLYRRRDDMQSSANLKRALGVSLPPDLVTVFHNGCSSQVLAGVEVRGRALAPVGNATYSGSVLAGSGFVTKDVAECCAACSAASLAGRPCSAFVYREHGTVTAGKSCTLIAAGGDVEFVTAPNVQSGVTSWDSVRACSPTASAAYPHCSILQPQRYEVLRNGLGLKRESHKRNRIYRGMLHGVGDRHVFKVHDLSVWHFPMKIKVQSRPVGTLQGTSRIQPVTFGLSCGSAQDLDAILWAPWNPRSNHLFTWEQFHTVPECAAESRSGSADMFLLLYVSAELQDVEFETYISLQGPPPTPVRKLWEGMPSGPAQAPVHALDIQGGQIVRTARSQFLVENLYKDDFPLVLNVDSASHLLVFRIAVVCHPWLGPGPPIGHAMYNDEAATRYAQSHIIEGAGLSGTVVIPWGVGACMWEQGASLEQRMLSVAVDTVPISSQIPLATETDLLLVNYTKSSSWTHARTDGSIAILQLDTTRIGFVQAGDTALFFVEPSNSSHEIHFTLLPHRFSAQYAAGDIDLSVGCLSHRGSRVHSERPGVNAEHTFASLQVLGCPPLPNVLVVSVRGYDDSGFALKAGAHSIEQLVGDQEVNSYVDAGGMTSFRLGPIIQLSQYRLFVRAAYGDSSALTVALACSPSLEASNQRLVFADSIREIDLGAVGADPCAHDSSKSLYAHISGSNSTAFSIGLVRANNLQLTGAFVILGLLMAVVAVVLTVATYVVVFQAGPVRNQSVRQIDLSPKFRSVKSVGDVVVLDDMSDRDLEVGMLHASAPQTSVHSPSRSPHVDCDHATEVSPCNPGSVHASSAEESDDGTPTTGSAASDGTDSGSMHRLRVHAASGAQCHSDNSRASHELQSLEESVDMDAKTDYRDAAEEMTGVPVTHGAAGPRDQVSDNCDDAPKPASVVGHVDGAIQPELECVCTSMRSCKHGGIVGAGDLQEQKASENADTRRGSVISDVKHQGLPSDSTKGDKPEAKHEGDSELLDTTGMTTTPLQVEDESVNSRGGAISVSTPPPSPTRMSDAPCLTEGHATASSDSDHHTPETDEVPHRTIGSVEVRKQQSSVCDPLLPPTAGISPPLRVFVAVGALCATLIAWVGYDDWVFSSVSATRVSVTRAFALPALVTGGSYMVCRQVVLQRPDAPVVRVRLRIVSVMAVAAFATATILHGAATPDQLPQRTLSPPALGGSCGFVEGLPEEVGCRAERFIGMFDPASNLTDTETAIVELKKLRPLMEFVRSLVGPEYRDQYDECVELVLPVICDVVVPRCDADCFALPPCTSFCADYEAQCAEWLDPLIDIVETLGMQYVEFVLPEPPEYFFSLISLPKRCHEGAFGADPLCSGAGYSPPSQPRGQCHPVAYSDAVREYNKARTESPDDGPWRKHRRVQLLLRHLFVAILALQGCYAAALAVRHWWLGLNSVASRRASATPPASSRVGMLRASLALLGQMSQDVIVRGHRHLHHPSLRDCVPFFNVFCTVVVAVNVVIAFEVSRLLDAVGQTALSIWFSLVCLLVLSRLLLSISKWDDSFSDAVKEYKYGSRTYRFVSPEDEASLVARMSFIIVAATAWGSRTFGIRGIHFDAMLVVEEAFEVTSQLWGLLQGLDTTPNWIVVVTMTALSVNCIGSLALGGLSKAQRGRQLRAGFDLILDTFYLGFTFQTFDPASMRLFDAVALTVPIVLASETLIDVAESMIVDRAVSLCDQAGVPQSMATSRTRILRTVSTHRLLRTRSRMITRRRCTFKLSTYVKVSASLLVTIVLIIAATSVARIVEQEAACRKEAGELWEAVAASSKMFYTGGIFGSTACNFHHVQHLTLPPHAQTIDDSIQLFTETQVIDARASTQLWHVSPMAGKLKQLGILQLDGTPVSSSLNWDHEDLATVPWKLLQFWANSLERLSLANNRIHALPPQLSQLKSLVVLNVSNNRLHTLPDSFNTLVNLRNLDITNNLVVDISNLNPWLGMLTHVYVGGNVLDWIPPSLVLDKEELELAPNPVISTAWHSQHAVLVKELMDLPLAHIEAVQTLLPELPASLIRLNRTLTTIDTTSHIAGFSGIAELDISKLGHLRFLSINRGRVADSFGQLPPALFQSSSLQTLDIRCVGAKLIPEQLWLMTELTELFAGWNDISDLPELPADASPKLKRLDLSFSKIEHVPRMLLQPPLNNSLELLYLEGTPAVSDDQQATLVFDEIQLNTRLKCRREHSYLGFVCYHDALRLADDYNYLLDTDPLRCLIR